MIPKIVEICKICVTFNITSIKLVPDISLSETTMNPLASHLTQSSTTLLSPTTMTNQWE